MYVHYYSPSWQERFVPDAPLEALNVPEGGPSPLTPSHPALPVRGGGDRRALEEHEAALQRLKELQKEMVGGERAG